MAVPYQRYVSNIGTIEDPHIVCNPQMRTRIAANQRAEAVRISNRFFDISTSALCYLVRCCKIAFDVDDRIVG